MIVITVLVMIVTTLHVQSFYNTKRLRFHTSHVTRQVRSSFTETLGNNNFYCTREYYTLFGEIATYSNCLQ